MIKIYNSISYFHPDEIIVDNESFFNNNIAARELSADSLGCMQSIDQAELLDAGIGTIRTPYGITSIHDLSTGCKTVLNCIFLYEQPVVYPTAKAIDATECGWDAIEEMFSFLEEKGFNSIGIVIEHTNDLYKCKDRDYLVNNTRRISSMFDFF